jgi:hypothetical protein
MIDDADDILIPDEVVDRIYAAAHLLPADTPPVHAVWFRKMWIGRALQEIEWGRRRGLARADASFDLGTFDERTTAEMQRMRQLILDEVYA